MVLIKSDLPLDLICEYFQGIFFFTVATDYKEPNRIIILESLLLASSDPINNVLSVLLMIIILSLTQILSFAF